MKRLSMLHSAPALTTAAGVLLSSGLLLFDFARRGTLDLTSVERIIGTALWIAWVSLPYLFFGIVGFLMIRVGRVSASVVTAVGVSGVLAGAAAYTYWVFVQPGMMSGLVFVSYPVFLLVGYAGLLGAVFLVKQARRITGR